MHRYFSIIGLKIVAIIPLPQNGLLKVVAVVVYLGLAFIFLPFVVGGGLVYLAYKKMPGGVLRNGLIAILGVFTLLVGSAWTVAVFSPTPPEKLKQEPTATVSARPQEDGQPAQEEVKAATTSAEQAKSFYQVSKVIDGDTISVDVFGKQEVVRLIGIDSPETVDPRKPVQCFGVEASNKAKELLLGKKVLLEADPSQGERDKYDRLLRYVFFEDDTSFNKLMIAEGYAHEYTYNTPYKYQAEYQEAERLARENKKGLWTDDACPTSTTPAPTPPPPQSSGSFTCAGKTKCGQMVSCAEAYFYLNNCGVSRLDGDKDGVPCETLCN